jgi:hypothetical protein
MSVPKTVVVSPRLPSDLASTISQACAWAGANVLGDNAERGSSNHTGVDAIVELLPAGERRIPESAMRLASELGPDAGVLLMCGERLVRPAMTLHGGRVTLLSAPFSLERVYSYLRILLLHGTGGAAWQLERTDGLSVNVHELAFAGGWVGALGVWPDGAPPHARVQGEAVTVTVPLASDVTQRELVHASGCLSRRASEPEKKLPALQKVVGARAGILHLAHERWCFYWPGDGSLRMHSEGRLPPMCDLSGSAKNGVVTLGRAPGDLAVGLSRSAEPWLAGNDRIALQTGGPAVLRSLASRAQAGAVNGSAFVAEVWQ